MTTNNLKEFIKYLIPYLDKDKMVVFTGAGLSTASGIKDFRGKNGLYKENINAEEILSHHYFLEHPKEFYEFYRDNLINDRIKPNLMHEVIAMLQQSGVVSGVITQNIDGLDTMAGTKDVIEIHGNANRFYCTGCGKKYFVDDIKNMDTVPICKCGKIIRPDIVLYEEDLERIKLWESQELIKNATSVLVLGSSLKVNPAASLIKDFLIAKRFQDNRKLFIVNQGDTDYDSLADYKYDGDIIDVARKIKIYKSSK